MENTRATKGRIEMLTIEKVKKEYFRIEELLGKEALTGTQYDADCKKGFSIFLIKRDLELSYNQVKKKIGAKIASSANNKGGTVPSTKKIYCERGGGQLIYANKCIPGCNDACLSCDNQQFNNIKASSDTLTAEQEGLMRHSIQGVHYAEMIEPFADK